MYNHILYLGYWVSNSFVLFLLSKIFPSEVILGNWRFVSLEATIYSGFWLTFLVWIWWDFSLAKGFKLKSWASFLYFWLANSFSVWAVSRLTSFTGIGLANFYWMFVVGFVCLVSQTIAWKLIVKKGSYFGTK